jgi:hypothetical protein
MNFHTTKILKLWSLGVTQLNQKVVRFTPIEIKKSPAYPTDDSLSFNLNIRFLAKILHAIHVPI